MPPGRMPSGEHRAAQWESTVQTKALGHARLAQGSPHAFEVLATGTVAQPASKASPSQSVFMAGP
jgi:hypothetical protein